MIFRMSKHATVDRIERLSFIAETIGLGEEYCRCKTANGQAYDVLTTTGISIIIDLNDETVITAFIASIDRATVIYKTFCREKNIEEQPIPRELYNKILANAILRVKYEKLQKANKID